MKYTEYKPTYTPWILSFRFHPKLPQTVHIIKQLDKKYSRDFSGEDLANDAEEHRLCAADNGFKDAREDQILEGGVHQIQPQCCASGDRQHQHWKLKKGFVNYFDLKVAVY